MKPGTLYLVPAPLDFGCTAQAPLSHSMPAATLEVAAQLPAWICENAKSTRAYLNRINELQPLLHKLQALQIQELPHAVHKKGDHTGTFDARLLLQPALQGIDMGLVCEAGMPAIADPGSSVVRAAHDLGVPVVPLVGPMSLVLALAASGLHGQSFAFVGYVAQNAGERAKHIKDLEGLALRTGQTQLLIETPYRNKALFEALLAHLQPSTRLAISCGLTLPEGWSRSARVLDWKKTAVPALGWPAVFCLGK